MNGTDTADRIRDYMARRPVAWMPHKNDDQPDLIVGEVLKVNSTTSDYDGHVVPIIEIAAEDDASLTWRVTAFDTVLDNELTSARPRPGERIGIKFDGTAEGARGTYRTYRVFVDRTTSDSGDDEAETPQVAPPEPDDRPPLTGPPDYADEPF